jgi:uncharacterized membrane protein
MVHIENTVSAWLKALKIKVSKTYLSQQLQSHPDYPSLVSIADTLNYLGISAVAYHTDKETMQNNKQPLLLHLNRDGGEINYYKDFFTARQQENYFDKHWTGIVMLADKPTAYGNAEHDKQQKLEKRNRLFTGITIALTAIVYAALSIINFHLPILLLILSNAAGLFFSRLIVQKEFGINNSLGNKICGLAKHSHCEAVLFSKGARLFNWLSWGDVGIVYFSTSLFYLFYTLIAPAGNIQLYYAISITGLVFPVYSLYYQYKIVKQWCMLCIGVLAAILANGAVSVFSINLSALFTLSTLSTLFTFSAILLLALSVWQLIKTILLKNLSSLTDKIKYAKLKRNPDVFSGLLIKQEYDSNNMPLLQDPLQFGNPNADLKLVIACNPYCGPCAKAHHAIESLFEKYSDSLLVSIRFTINTGDENDRRIIAAQEVLHAAKQDPFTAVKDWYSEMNIEKFREKHRVNESNEANHQGFSAGDEMINLKKQIAWGKKAGITGTPTIFLNGRKIPEQYNWQELSEQLEQQILVNV